MDRMGKKGNPWPFSLCQIITSFLDPITLTTKGILLAKFKYTYKRSTIINVKQDYM